MFGGNPEQLEQMMQQMGIDLEELDADRVVIETADGDDLVFDDVSVNRMNGQGQEVYQVMGSPTTKTTSDTEDTEESTSSDTEVETQEVEITEDDVELVALRAGVDEDTAREGLEEADGNLAEAIAKLS